MESEITAPRIRCQGIRKTYPSVIANDDINLTIAPGEIHALLGENGAGKSTLMKILYGVTEPDAGTIWWNGERLSINSPAQARRLGIGMVFQHFSLFETLTVVENIALSVDKGSYVNMAGLAEKIREISTHYGMPVDPHRLVSTLSTGERQRVEIIRCLVQDVSLLILDEPTSVLTPGEVESLFKTLIKLSKEGCSLLFISHKLHEVQALCQKATILRHGRVSGECGPRNTSTQAMASLMVGSKTILGTRYPKRKGQSSSFQITGLNEPADDPFGTSLKDINLTVREGEILGIAGVAGNGQSELLRFISGERVAKNNQSLSINETPIGHMSPSQRRRVGLAVVPEERLGRGAVPDMDLSDNALLTAFLQNTVRHGFLQTSAIQRFAKSIISQFGVKTPGHTAAAKSLSGGNLQKFIIGREILQNPRLLICASPTWGVDVGAANTIHEAFITLRDRGSSILVLSEDLDELFQISDRIGVLCEGKLSPVKPVSDTSIEEVGSWMAGVFHTDTITHRAESGLTEQLETV